MRELEFAGVCKGVLAVVAVDKTYAYAACLM